VEYIKDYDGTIYQLVTKENSQVYIVPLNKVYVDNMAHCDGTYYEDNDIHYGMIILDKNININDIDKDLLDVGQSIDITVIEINNPPSVDKDVFLVSSLSKLMAHGYSKNTYRVSNYNGQPVKELISSEPSTLEAYSQFLVDMGIKEISGYCKQNISNKSQIYQEAKPVSSIIYPAIVFITVALLGLITFVIINNKKKRH
jgi:hypothetical protein